MTPVRRRAPELTGKPNMCYHVLSNRIPGFLKSDMRRLHYNKVEKRELTKKLCQGYMVRTCDLNRHATNAFR